MTRKCPRCSALGGTPDKVCTACGGCYEHHRCLCATCARCAKRVPPKARCTSCRERDGVHICLDCHGAASSGAAYASFPLRKCEFKGETLTTTFTANALKRSLGVEVELADWGKISVRQGVVARGYVSPSTKLMPDFVGEWTRDGSVVPSGIELVSKKMLGDNYLEAMGQLLRVLEPSGAVANTTCGYHVHVDGGDLTMMELRRILVGWQGIQRLVYGTLVAPFRVEDATCRKYCRPIILDPSAQDSLMSLVRGSEISEWFYTWLYWVRKDQFTEAARTQRAAGLKPDVAKMLASSVREKRSVKYMNSARRMNLNFHAWMMRGAMEFRLKEGTTNKEDLLFWPLWCGWCLDYLASLSDAEALRIANGKGPGSIVELTQSFKPGSRTNGLQDWVAAKPKIPVKWPELKPIPWPKDQAEAARLQRAEGY